jgi:ABC-type transport system substrate-binding protein
MTVMTTKRFLILIPLALLFILAQSYFWIPTYEQQEKGNPNRPDDFIYTSIADATILNPTISSSKSSNDIETRVFDSLVDVDESLQIRNRLATHRDIHEEAFFYVNTAADIPDRGRLSGPQLVELLRSGKSKENRTQSGLQKTLDNIQAVSLIPPDGYSTSRQQENPDNREEKSEVKITVSAPARIKLELDQVDQDLFKNLTRLLGENYYSSFRGEEFLKTEPPVAAPTLASFAQELLPATEHNPIIDFRLRPNVKFHDGHIFDAEDVKFTYEAIMNPKNLSPRVSDFEPIKAVQVIDPLTVRIVYKRLFSSALLSWSMGILPEHLLNSQALKKEAVSLGKNPDEFSVRESAFNRNPVGCGPFRFQEWKSDQYIILNRFDEYWEGPPNYQRYVYRIIPDYLAQEMELYAGTVDYYKVQPYQAERLKDDPRFQRFSVPELGYTYIGYNARRKPFDDRRVRLALSKAIDVGKIIKYVLHNQGERTTGPYPIQTDFYNHDVAPLDYDPEGALKLLAEAGWKRNSEGWLEKDGQRLQFTLITNNGNDTRKAILAIAQNSWRQLGIDVRTDLLEWSVFLQERITKLDFDAMVLGWVLTIDPDLYQLWHSSQTDLNQLNHVGFKNRQADELIVKIRQEYDRSQQVRDCHRLHEIIAYEQPYTFLFVEKWNAVLDKRIVLRETDETGNAVYRKIPAPPVDDIHFHLNEFVKPAQMPVFEP